MEEVIFQITPQVQKLVEVCERCDKVESDLYKEYDVKRGLRDINGKGVVAGLTNISEVHAKNIVNGEEVPCDGMLFYRGYEFNTGLFK